MNFVFALIAKMLVNSFYFLIQDMKLASLLYILWSNYSFRYYFRALLNLK